LFGQQLLTFDQSSRAHHVRRRRSNDFKGRCGFGSRAAIAAPPKAVSEFAAQAPRRFGGRSGAPLRPPPPGPWVVLAPTQGRLSTRKKARKMVPQLGVPARAAGNDANERKSTPAWQAACCSLSPGCATNRARRVLRAQHSALLLFRVRRRCRGECGDVPPVRKTAHGARRPQGSCYDGSPCARSPRTLLHRGSRDRVLRRVLRRDDFGGALSAECGSLLRCRISLRRRRRRCRLAALQVGVGYTVAVLARWTLNAALLVRMLPL